MAPTITANDVLLYIYNELDELKARAVEDELLINDHLAELYLLMSDNKRSLNANLYSPGEGVVNKIRAYAASSQQKLAGL